MADRKAPREPKGAPIDKKSKTSSPAAGSPPVKARSMAMNLSFETAGFEDLVRARAYALWESEGRPAGRDAEHWRLSEEETRHALAKAEAAAEAAAKPAKPKAAKAPAAKAEASKSETAKPKTAPRKPAAKKAKP